MRIARERLGLLSPEANSVFGGPTSFDGDWSLAALYRAIVSQHTKLEWSDAEEKTIILKYRAYAPYAISDYSEIEHGCNRLSIVEVSGGFDMKEGEPSGWVTPQQICGKPFPASEYLSQFARTKVFVNPELHSVVAFVERRATSVWMQAFESILCRLMPWYFSPELPEEEIKFFQSIAVDNKALSPEEKEAILIAYVENATKAIDLREWSLRKNLTGVGDAVKNMQLRSLASWRRDVTERIRRCKIDLAQMYRDFDKCVCEIAAFEALKDKGDEELFSFFRSHKMLGISRVDGSDLTFSVVDTLEFYDEDEVARILDQEHSWLRCEYDVEDQNLIEELFVNRRGLIRVCAEFCLGSMKYISPKEGSLPADNAMPNPHIYFFGCSGGNDLYYNQYAESGEWQLAIEQAVSATKNINWGDSTVCRRMIGWFRENRDVPCVYVNNGDPIYKVESDSKLVSISEFITLLKERKNEDGKTNLSDGSTD